MECLLKENMVRFKYLLKYENQEDPRVKFINQYVCVYSSLGEVLVVCFEFGTKYRE